MSSTARTTTRRQQQQQFAHIHVPAFRALPWTRLQDENENDNGKSDNDSSSSSMIQVIRDGSLLTTENLCANTTVTTPSSGIQQQPPRDPKKLSLRQPMLILDTPESIGMKLPCVPAVAATKRKRRTANDKDNEKFSIRHVADLLGNAFPVRVINVQNQQELPDWTLGDLVDYFADEERVLWNAGAAAAHNSNSNNTDRNETATTNHAGDVVTADDAPQKGQQRPVRRAAARASVMDRKQHDDEMKLVLNQISLEFSHTMLRDKVQSPQFVRDLDWIDHAWRFPSSRSSTNSTSSENNNGQAKKDKPMTTSNNTQHSNNISNHRALSYPAVQYYCLTSAAGCYTDFHVDFGGSSVWYNVLVGEKHFCLVPPTPTILQLYEEWLCSPTQASDFFAQIVLNHHHHPQKQDETANSSDVVVYKIALKERQTLIIPAGWIHSVYTPCDSLVFGGNFLHGMDIETQLNVYSIEVRSRVLEQYRFPLFVQVHFAAASMYLRLLKQMQEPSSSCQQNRRPSLLEVQSLGRLIEAVTVWWNPSTTMAAAISTDDDDDDPNTNLSEVVRQVTAEHDCATFQHFLTMLQEEHERALLILLVGDMQQQEQNRAIMASSSSSSSAAADDDKVEKAKTQPATATLNGNCGKSATSPRLRVKLSVSSNSKVVVNASHQDESKLSSSGVGLVYVDDSDDKFRIEVSAASRQGRTLVSRKSRKKVASNDNDEWLPSSERKQQQQRGRRREKEPSFNVATGDSDNDNGRMSATALAQDPAKNRAKKPETKTTTARQRLLKKVGR